MKLKYLIVFFLNIKMMNYMINELKIIFLNSNKALQ